MKRLICLTVGILLTGCASTEVTRTSASTILVDVSAAPACGGTGASRVAQKTVAVETIRAGYDRFIIMGGAAANNVQVTQMPGQYNTTGTLNTYGNYGTYNSTTRYTPGPTVVSGSHDKSLSVKMFRDGERGAEEAVDARLLLGPEWHEIVTKGVKTCL
jgi:hypothetical protein